MFDLLWVVFVQVDTANEMLWLLDLDKNQHCNWYSLLVPMYLAFVRLVEEKKRRNALIQRESCFFKFKKRCQQKKQLFMILPGHFVHDVMDVAPSASPNFPARQSLHFDCPS